MKRNNEYTEEFNNNKVFKYDNNLIKKSTNKPDFVYQYISSEFGSKIGLIFGSKLLGLVKVNGIPLILNFLNYDYPNNIFQYIQNINISDTNSTHQELRDNRELFYKYYDTFTNSFNISFFKYLKYNLKDFKGIIKWINDSNY